MMQQPAGPQEVHPSVAGDVVVLVPAAGQGVRMGGAPKQFRTLGGQPLLVQTLRVFEQHPAVSSFIVAVPAASVEEVKAGLAGVQLSKCNAVVAGGATRQQSVAAALAAVPSAAGIVLVHDAVRPFLDAAHLAAVIEAVRRFGAAALAVPVADTLRRVAAEQFGPTVPRDGLYRMQTPQGFRRDWFEQAHAAARREGYEATDDVALVQRAGYPVQVVEGSPRNIKVTTPADWALAELLWADRAQVQPGRERREPDLERSADVI